MKTHSHENQSFLHVLVVFFSHRRTKMNKINLKMAFLSIYVKSGADKKLPLEKACKCDKELRQTKSSVFCSILMPALVDK